MRIENMLLEIELSWDDRKILKDARNILRPIWETNQLSDKEMVFWFDDKTEAEDIIHEDYLSMFWATLAIISDSNMITLKS